MQLTICKDSNSAALRLADVLEESVLNKPDLVMGLATGRTSMGAYRELVRRHQRDLRLTFRHVTTFNTDEFVGVSPWSPNSNRTAMNIAFFHHIDVAMENTYVMRGDVADSQAECRAYEHLLSARGGLDVVVLGLGYNGHIGFNEPGSGAKSRTRVVEFTESTLAALSDGERFKNLHETPQSALTLGLADILQAKHVLLIATGIGKAEAVQKLFESRPGPSFPASLLLDHPNLSVILDNFSAERVHNLPECVRYE